MGTKGTMGRGGKNNGNGPCACVRACVNCLRYRRQLLLPGLVLLLLPLLLSLMVVDQWWRWCIKEILL